jgi:hypothetical protein
MNFTHEHICRYLGCVCVCVWVCVCASRKNLCTIKACILAFMNGHAHRNQVNSNPPEDLHECMHTKTLLLLEFE